MYTCPLARVIRYSTAWLRYLPSRSPLSPSVARHHRPCPPKRNLSINPPLLYFRPLAAAAPERSDRENFFFLFLFSFLAGIVRATTRDFLVAASTNIDIPRNRSPAHSTADPALEQHHPPQPPHHTPVDNSQRRDRRGGDAVSSFGSSEPLFFSSLSLRANARFLLCSIASAGT